MPETVTGLQLNRPVEAGFTWFADRKTALIETALVSGAQHLAADNDEPLGTTSFGTGELMLAARAHGAAKILLAVGDNAAVDLGMGCSAALGWRFLDVDGKVLDPIGTNLLKVRQIERPSEAWDVPVEVLCNGTYPLLGISGTAHVAGSELDISRADVVLLEVGLTHFASHMASTLQADVSDVPGAGVGGGLAAGAAVFFDAQLLSGIDTVLEAVGATAAIDQADWVATTTTTIPATLSDHPTLMGLATTCQVRQKPLVVFCQHCHLHEEQWRQQGIQQVVTLPSIDATTTVSEALQEAITGWSASHLVTNA
jgi:glycerate kinase